MRNTYTLCWQNKPNDYKTLQMKGFKTRSQAVDYVKQNNIKTYWITYTE